MRFRNLCALASMLAACGGGSGGTDAGASDASIGADSGDHDDGGTGADGGALDGGDGGTIDGASGDPCAALLPRFDRWLTEHRSCSDSAACERLGAPELPENDAFFCNRVGTRPDSELEELTASWRALGCGDESACPGLPGRPVCVAGTCALDDTTGRCLACDWDDFDPYCTEDGLNAFNPCAARECLWSEPATPGWCPDTPGCVALGGWCEETTYDAQPCPDGYRYPFPERPDVDCAGGHPRDYCCVPWDAGCTFAAGSWQLSVNPITCAPMPETCIGFGEPDSCVVDATLGPIPATLPVWDTVIAVQLELGNQAAIEGTDPATGRTFRCTGAISHDWAFPEAWSCTSCAGDVCTTCSALQAAYCSL